jgi:hypothetical protein
MITKTIKPPKMKYFIDFIHDTFSDTSIVHVGICGLAAYIGHIALILSVHSWLEYSLKMIGGLMMIGIGASIGELSKTATRKIIRKFTLKNKNKKNGRDEEKRA